jgi:hypothetical protein
MKTISERTYPESYPAERYGYYLLQMELMTAAETWNRILYSFGPRNARTECEGHEMKTVSVNIAAHPPTLPSLYIYSPSSSRSNLLIYIMHTRLTLSAVIFTFPCSLASCEYLARITDHITVQLKLVSSLLVNVSRILSIYKVK